MTWLPFICLGIGLAAGWRFPFARFYRAADLLSNAALIVLMLTIGANIGVNDSLIASLPKIGLHCVAIILSAMVGSVVLMVLFERTILPLEQIAATVRENALDESGAGEAGSKGNSRETGERIAGEEEKKGGGSFLLLSLPVSVIAGILGGRFLLPHAWEPLLDWTLTLSLIVLYSGVGVSLGENRGVFRFIRLLGWKVLLPSVAVLLGSLAGGAAAGFLLRLPPEISVVSAGGMGYYSITGVYLTQTCGAEAGTYGFMVNVMRDLFTVLLLPLVVRISKGSAIACGAAGNMDTMLMPVTKFVGPELGLVALITGTLTTFLVPFLLPVLSRLVS